MALCTTFGQQILLKHSFAKLPLYGNKGEQEGYPWPYNTQNQNRLAWLHLKAIVSNLLNPPPFIPSSRKVITEILASFSA